MMIFMYYNVEWNEKSIPEFQFIFPFTMRRTLLLKSEGVNFINVFCMRLSYKILAPKTTKLVFGFEILAPKILCKNCAHACEKCWWNWQKEKYTKGGSMKHISSFYPKVLQHS